MGDVRNQYIRRMSQVAVTQKPVEDAASAPYAGIAHRVSPYKEVKRDLLLIERFNYRTFYRGSIL